MKLNNVVNDVYEVWMYKEGDVYYEKYYFAI